MSREGGAVSGGGAARGPTIRMMGSMSVVPAQHEGTGRGHQRECRAVMSTRVPVVAVEATACLRMSAAACRVAARVYVSACFCSASNMLGNKILAPK